VNNSTRNSAADKNLKISFCTSCRGANYLERLQQTLPENIRRNTGKEHYGNVEFVIVAYGDPSVTQWLADTFPEEIKSGLIRVVDLPREQAEYFKMAHAKNIAHRMATGDVLCNLDCDNITGENFAGWLNQQFSHYSNIVASMTTRDRLISKLTTGDKMSDLTGRIAISRDNFERLHGYDENYNAAKDGDDVNLKERAYAVGLKPISFPASIIGTVIKHSDEERQANMSPQDQKKSEHNFHQGGDPRFTKAMRVWWGEDAVLPDNLQPANPDGAYGCAEVTMLDQSLQPQPHTLAPNPHDKWVAAYVTRPRQFRR